jgi:RNA polymerase sigma factor (TIGR02999 family)
MPICLIEVNVLPVTPHYKVSNYTSIAQGQETAMLNNEPVTVLLYQWRNGNSAALDQLSPLIYKELHEIASQYLRKDNKAHILKPAQLIQEIFDKFLNSEFSWFDRKYFYLVAAWELRSILVNFAHVREQNENIADDFKIAFDENSLIEKLHLGIIDIDKLLGHLEKIDPKKHQMLELYYFAGLKVDEIAKCYRSSCETIQRELQSAETWLNDSLNTENRSLH